MNQYLKLLIISVFVQLFLFQSLVSAQQRTATISPNVISVQNLPELYPSAISKTCRVKIKNINYSNYIYSVEVKMKFENRTTNQQYYETNTSSIAQIDYGQETEFIYETVGAVFPICGSEKISIEGIPPYSFSPTPLQVHSFGITIIGNLQVEKLGMSSNNQIPNVTQTQVYKLKHN